MNEEEKLISNWKIDTSGDNITIKQQLNREKFNISAKLFQILDVCLF